MDINKQELQKILISINPKIKSHINKIKVNLTNDGLIDSLMIIKLIHKIETLTKKKIKIHKINKNTFSNINSILKFLNK